MNLNIGGVIRKLRIEHKMTQEELAEKLCVSFQAVSKWECGTTTPDIATLPHIALIFGVSMDVLFSMESNDYIERISSLIYSDHIISSENFVWAERYLKGLLTEDHTNNKARELLIALYSYRENLDSMAQGDLAEEAILLEPMHPDFNKKLEMCRKQRNEVDRLIAFWNKILEKTPENYIVREDLISVCIDERYLEKAKTLINTAPTPRHAYNLFMGDLKLIEGDEKSAKEIWLDATKKANDAWTFYEAGKRFEKIRNYDVAIELWKKSYEMTPGPVKWMDSLYACAFVYEKMGKFDLAIDMWEQIVASLSNNFNINNGKTVDRAKNEIIRLKSLK